MRCSIRALVVIFVLITKMRSKKRRRPGGKKILPKKNIFFADKKNVKKIENPEMHGLCIEEVKNT